MKTAVIYWSGTGNTEAMAHAVAEGMTAAGTEAVLLTPAEVAPGDLNAYAAIAFGCPAMGAEVLEETEFQPMFDACKRSLGGKRVALFGSYGWGDGEWMRTWESDCDSAGVNLVCESVICTETPDDAALEACRALGRALVVFQGLPKADKMELIIQKAVELGAFQVIPVAMKRCVVKLDEKKADSKIKRWQGIAEAAAKQSKRGVIPTVAPVMSYAQAVKMASEMDLKLVPYELAEGMEQTKQLIESVKPGQRIAIFIGPEGGFDPEEIRTATEAAIQPITLGKRILRTETAGFTTIAWLMYQLEN